eukprot:1196215-Prorocentrum_minimum.AAC.7
MGGGRAERGGVPDTLAMFRGLNVVEKARMVKSKPTGPPVFHCWSTSTCRVCKGVLQIKHFPEGSGRLQGVMYSVQPCVQSCFKGQQEV